MLKVCSLSTLTIGCQELELVEAGKKPDDYTFIREEQSFKLVTFDRETSLVTLKEKYGTGSRGKPYQILFDFLFMGLSHTIMLWSNYLLMGFISQKLH